MKNFKNVIENWDKINEVNTVKFEMDPEFDARINGISQNKEPKTFKQISEEYVPVSPETAKKEDVPIFIEYVEGRGTTPKLLLFFPNGVSITGKAEQYTNGSKEQSLTPNAELVGEISHTKYGHTIVTAYYKVPDVKKEPESTYDSIDNRAKRFMNNWQPGMRSI